VSLADGAVSRVGTRGLPCGLQDALWTRQRGRAALLQNVPCVYYRLGFPSLAVVRPSDPCEGSPSPAPGVSRQTPLRARTPHAAIFFWGHPPG
jgi:hypothetical protein